MVTWITAIGNVFKIYFPSPITVIDKVRKALVSMKKAAPEEEALERYKTALGTLLKYLGNIAAHPDEEKFR